MPITTKTGDKGKTSLACGKRLFKDHLRIEICGNLDELNSYLGLAKNLTKAKKIKKIIESIQKNLFVIGAEIATESKSLKKLKLRVNSRLVKDIEVAIDQLAGKLPSLKPCFYLPGKSLSSSVLDLSRVTARKLERRVVSLNKKKALKNKFILIYLNRLSDFLFLLTRKSEKIAAKKR